MRGDDLEPGKAIERSLEDQVGERDRGLERIADRVAEPAIAREPLVELGHTLRMDEQAYGEFLGLCPYRMKLRIGEFDAIDNAADRRTLQPLLLYGCLKLLHCKIGCLQCQRSEGSKPVRL